MSDTPRTDLVGGYGAMLEHAHQLERELTALRAELLDCQQALSRQQQLTHDVQKAANAQREVRVSIQSECEGLRRDAELRRAIHRAARELPKGKVVSVCVENGAGWVYWSDEIGFVHQVEPNDLTLAGQVNFAIDAAMSEGRSDE